MFPPPFLIGGLLVIKFLLLMAYVFIRCPVSSDQYALPEKLDNNRL